MEKKLLVILVIILSGALAYTWGTKKTTQIITPSPEVSPVTALPSSSLSPVVVDETELIKQAIYDLTGLTAAKAEVTISKQIGNFATGGIKEY
ncbi:MAG: hypothetical protein V1810_00375, partial [Candidatus Beckwithbacteria bacterium]